MASWVGWVSAEAGQVSRCGGITKRTYRIGHNRGQISLLAPCLEDYVGADNPVRAIDSYVASLDLIRLGFCDVGSDGGAGQPRAP
jgi:hypothetical protein